MKAKSRFLVCLYSVEALFGLIQNLVLLIGKWCQKNGVS